MIYSKREKIIEEITKRLTRDNGAYFTDRARLDHIKSILKESEYDILCETPLSVSYKKKSAKLPERIVLISSHVDCVMNMTKGDFIITNEGNYMGTFDNAATNAALVIAMLENKLSENIIVSFTGNEEEYSKGAKEVIEFLEGNKKKVIAISLDVTFDLRSEINSDISTYDYASYTIDNLCNNTEEAIAKRLFETADKLGIPFMVTRAGEEDYFDRIDERTISDYYDNKLEVADTAYEDEAIRYYKNKSCIGAFSLCLPTDDTDYKWYMHSNNPITIKKQSFNDYIEALVKISNSMTEW